MSLPGAREVAGGLVCAPYVVGNLKETFKSDTPKTSPTVLANSSRHT